MRAVFVSLAVFSLMIPVAVAQGAEACGVCHSKLASEWRESPHAGSWTNERFQAELQKTQNSEFCARCHAAQSVWEQIKIEGTAGEGSLVAPKPAQPVAYEAVLSEVPAARSEMLEEGVSCGACHLIQVFSPAGNREDFLGPYHTAEGHTGREAGEFKTYRVCGSCHGREAAAYLPEGVTLSPDYYHSRAEPIHFSREGGDCNGCHMPPSESRLVQLRTFRHLPARQVGSHTFAEARFDNLAGAIELSAAGNGVAVTNRGLGHPLRVCGDSSFEIVVSAMRGKEKVGTHEQDFLSEDGLAQGATISIPLPFELKGGDTVDVRITLRKPGQEPRAIVEKKIQAG